MPRNSKANIVLPRRARRYAQPLAQTGAGLIAAIALIVVVAFIVVAIARTMTASVGLSNLETLGHRASLAASSAAELSLNRSFAPNGAGVCDVRTWDLSTLPGLPECNAQVACSEVLSGGRGHLTLTSEATCQAGALQVQRRVLVRAERD